MSDKRRFKWYRQRKKLGFDDRETWSLDHTIAKFALPRLIRFKEVKCGYPSCFSSSEEWDVILDKMIYALQAIVDEFNGTKNTISATGDGIKGFRKHIRKEHEGLVLFGKYFGHLWW
jgi:hypothetical protein